ncbi:hypothetical protein ACUNGZ_27500, partial [Serratia sp. IR-2025]
MKVSKMEQSRMFITSIIILLERYIKQPISIINLIDKTGYSREGANKQVISSQADSLIKISRIWADFFPANTSNQP